MRRALLLLLLVVLPAIGQEIQHENPLAAELRLETGRFRSSCAQFSIVSCAELLLTDHPLHIAVGSIAPGDGFGLGPALILHEDAKNWLFKWDADGIVTPNGSWRAGAYMQIIPTAGKPAIPRIEASTLANGLKKSGNRERLPPAVRTFERPLITTYFQSISLRGVAYFGEGPSSTVNDRSFFGLRETIIGSSATMPIPDSGILKIALFGEMNFRSVGIHEDREGGQSIGQLFTPSTAPGLAAQPAFLQLGEGLRLSPGLAYGRVKLSYMVKFEQFTAPADPASSFRRFTVDLSHEVRLFGTAPPNAQPGNGPDDCAANAASGAPDCPRVSASRNRDGALNLRALLIESKPSGSGAAVPFYFQPTLGGSDINGATSLASYRDYRFRGPDLLLFHAGLEHSLFGTPIGLSLGADAGKIAVTPAGARLSHLAHSYSAGLTFRAGGFPQFVILFAWGGREGTRMIAHADTSLLRGSPRPSLY